MESKESGGFIFGSYAYCPRCAPGHLKNIRRYGEDRYIKAQCAENQSFADFVREYRGDRNFIQVISGKAAR